MHQKRKSVSDYGRFPLNLFGYIVLCYFWNNDSERKSVVLILIFFLNMIYYDFYVFMTVEC